MKSIPAKYGGHEVSCPSVHTNAPSISGSSPVCNVDNAKPALIPIVDSLLGGGDVINCGIEYKQSHKKIQSHNVHNYF